MRTTLKHIFSILFFVIHIMGIIRLSAEYMAGSVFGAPGNLEIAFTTVIVLAVLHVFYLFLAFKFKFINQTFVILYLVADCFHIGFADVWGGFFAILYPHVFLTGANSNAFLWQFMVCKAAIALRIAFSVPTLIYLKQGSVYPQSGRRQGTVCVNPFKK